MNQSQMRAAFIDLISGHSENAYCAGWMTGIDTIIRLDGGLWTVLAAACDGWPVGYRAEGGWDPLTPTERAEALALVGGTDD